MKVTVLEMRDKKKLRVFEQTEAALIRTMLKCFEV